MPEVARRVVAEWTSSVLASDRARAARVDAAASRRDITRRAACPEPVPSSALRPRNLDYGAHERRADPGAVDSVFSYIPIAYVFPNPRVLDISASAGVRSI